MPDFVLLDGDTVLFLPTFGQAIVVVQPGTLTGTGSNCRVSGTPVCVEGDEEQVSVSGCAYSAGQYIIPGTGTLTIESLAEDQVATMLTVGGVNVLLKGSLFTAKFTVSQPAKAPPKGTAPPDPDTTTEYSGQGSFVTTNTLLLSD